MVVIVDCDLVEDVVHAKVLGMVFKLEKFLGAFVGGNDFGFTLALCSLVLSDGALGNRPATATDEVAGERSIVEEFKRGTVGDGISKLATPVRTTEIWKLMDLRW